MRKTLKRVLAALCITAFLSASICDVAMAQDIDANIQTAYQHDWLYDSLINKHKKEITRKEFCEVIMAYYRTTTGKTGITLDNDQFFDTRSIDVAAACEFGFMSGVEEHVFKPNDFITRKDAAVALYKLFKACNQELRESNSTVDYFKDISKYDEETKLAINTLRENEIMVGNDSKFHPESEILIYEVAAALVRTYEVSSETYFVMGDKKILINESVEALITDFGQPERIDVDEYGRKRYVYNSRDVESFFMVSIEEGKVKEIFSNSSGYKFGDIVSGMNYSEIDFTGFSTVSSTSALKKEEFYNIKLIFNADENGVVLDSIQIYVPKAIIYNGNFNSNFTESVEKELWDIIRIKRLKSGLEGYVKDNELYTSVKKNNAEIVRNSNSGNKERPKAIDRLETDKICFTAAVESTFSVRGGSIMVYENILKDVGSRAVLKSTTVNNAVVSCAIVDNNLYTAIVLYK